VPRFFTKKTLAFLRALKRNNDREWFRARKPDYEQHVRAPMVALLGQLARDLPAFAPDLVSDPRVCLFRIYRDTRFSDDKRPLKTHVAAHFPSRQFAKGDGAGMYVEITPQWVWMGGGIYMPSSPELQSIRASIAEEHRKFHRIVTAAGYLRHKQYIGGREYAAEFALSPRFYPELLKVFRAIAPLVGFLNAAIVRSSNHTREFTRSLAG
jgi:uncharacterized protein (DUF2461 family)